MKWALAALAFFLTSAVPAQGPKLDLNTASAAQLQTLPGIGPTTAKRIARIRERNGPYRCVEELRGLPRITEAQFQVLNARTFVEHPDPRCEAQDSARRAGKPVKP